MCASPQWPLYRYLFCHLPWEALSLRVPFLTDAKHHLFYAHTQEAAHCWKRNPTILITELNYTYDHVSQISAQPWPTILSSYPEMLPQLLSCQTSEHLPPTRADSIILCFFEKIGTIRWELLPSSFIKSSCLLAFVLKYSASHPVTGDKLSLILSMATWALQFLLFQPLEDFITTVIPYLSITSIDSSILNHRNVVCYLPF